MALAKETKPKKPRGYNNAQALEWLDDDRLALLEGWARDGYTYSDIADKIGITLATLQRWREKYPEIAEALSKGREVVDYKVENALLKAALGYRVKETKVTIETNNKTGDVVSTIREVTERDVQPNVTACQVWLYNRLPEKWKRNRDKVLELTDEDSGVQITVVRADGANDEQDESEVVNKGVSIKPGKGASQSSKDENRQDVDDVDYWPEDWEDDDE